MYIFMYIYIIFLNTNNLGALFETCEKTLNL